MNSLRRVMLGAGLVFATFPLTALLADSADDADSARAESRWSYIEFSMQSWGQPISSWRITGSGGGSWTETRTGPETVRDRPILVWHEIADDPQLYLALETILKRLPQEAPDHAMCENFMTDMPYGTLRLRRGATTLEFDWNAGCLDADYTAFMATLKEADELIAAKGRNSPVLREEQPQ